MRESASTLRAWSKLFDAFYTTKSDGMGIGCPSAAPSSRDIMAAVCGQSRTKVRVPHFRFLSLSFPKISSAQIRAMR